MDCYSFQQAKREKKSDALVKPKIKEICREKKQRKHQATGVLRNECQVNRGHPLVRRGEEISPHPLGFKKMNQNEEKGREVEPGAVGKTSKGRGGAGGACSLWFDQEISTCAEKRKGHMSYP